MRPTRLVAVGLVLALVGGLLLVREQGRAPLAGRPEVVADPGGAIAAALAHGAPVRVGSLTTPTREVYAQPDGKLRAELSAVPLRAWSGDRWVPVDTTLARRADGAVAPRAVNAGITFSGGGGTELVRIAKEGRSVALQWPTPLPTPRLEGATATYPEVFPGVDLRMIAEVGGYQQHLVVSSPEAARAPGLAAVRLGVRLDGVTLTADGSGGLTATAPDGAVVFSAPPSIMWDAAGRSAQVGVEVGGDAMVLRPDAAFLADPAIQYPVTVDPRMGDWGKTAWATVVSGKPNQTFWWSSGDKDGRAQVGRCYEDGTCNGIGEAWSYFQFDTGFVAGKEVLGSTFQITATYGPNCDNRPQHLHVAGGQVGPGTTWNNRPQGDLLRAKDVKGVHTNCRGFRQEGFDFLNAGVGGVATYYLRAGNTNQLSWRKYDPASARLLVTYNSAPDTPSHLGSYPTLPQPCRWCDGVPYVGTENIRVSARLSDPEEEFVRPLWHIYTDGTHEERWGSPQTSGAAHDTLVDLRDKHGKKVDLWVQGWDSRDDQPFRGGEWDNVGPFMVDREPVTKAPTVDSALYRPDNDWHGGVGVTGTFTFGAAGTADVDHYLYGWQDPPTTPVAASALGGPASVDIAPTSDGPQTLHVRAVDRAGNPGPIAQYRVLVRAGNGAFAQWSFDGNAKDSAYVGDRHGTVSGGATYEPGAVGQAIVLDGVDDVVTAPNTVPSQTSYSVSAWLKVTSEPAAGALATALSQDGSANSALQLGYRKVDSSEAVWELYAPGADSTDHSGDTAVRSAVAATANAWTHVAAVYDAPKREYRLYVNGLPAGSVTRPADAFPTSGDFVVGRGKHHGDAVNRFSGGVDEVKAYDRSLSDAEVRAQVRQDGVQLGQWRFDESSGSTAVNVVPGGAAGVLRGGARFVREGAVNGAVLLDKPEQHVGTGGPVVRTDQSFSVSTWVRLDANAPAASALSQDDQRVSGFSLGYRDTNGGRWEWRLASDREGARQVSVLGSVPAARGVWTHLTGVYDAAAREARLYVDGDLVGSAPRTEAFNATGELLVGRARVGGALGEHWTGAVDELRVYGWAIGQDEVQGLVGRDGVSAGTWPLDGDTVDTSGRGRAGTAHGGPSWSGGQSAYPVPTDLAIQLDGSDDQVTAPHAVDTDRGMTVTAWARVDRAGGEPTVVSQDGGQVSAFRLHATADGKWAFTMPKADRADAGVDTAAGGTVQVGAWVALAGVHRPGAKQVQLYVNGVLAASSPHETAWNGGGGVRIGAAKTGGFLTGAVDDVAVFGRQLFAAEIQDMAGRDLSQVHHWKLDEPGGGNAGDSVGSRTGTLSGGAAFTDGRVGNSVRFDGVDDAVATTGVDVRTDKDFTVTAWVSLDGNTTCDLTKVRSCRRDAVSLAGTRGSKFRVGHVVDRDHREGNWIFEMPESDTDNAPVTKAAVSVAPGDVSAPGEPRKWVHLAAVYDASAHQLWLYVDGLREGDGTLQTTSAFGGELNIGRARVNGAYTAHWPGYVDDVRVHAGAWAKDRVSALFRSFPSEAASSALPRADAGQWRLDEGSGTTASDSSGRGGHLALTGGPGWTGGRTGQALVLDGTQYGQTAGPVLDTSSAFTASGWVYLADTSTTRIAFGQDGSRAGAFAVGYLADTGRWGLSVPERTDVDWPATTLVTSRVAAVAGDWTHLAVVHDPVLKQIRLYVNGVLEVAQVGVRVAASDGPFTVGRGKFNGATDVGRLRGVVDDVRTHTRALSGGEIRALHDDAANPLIGSWRFTDGSGADDSYRRNTARITGGTTVPGPHASALRFDGTGSAVTGSPGASLRDSVTFSVWARLDRLDRTQTIIAQDGGRTSGFVLQYRAGLGRWLFGAPRQDADGADLVYATETTATAAVGRWTHLVGVYDHPARQLRLYVDGALGGVAQDVGLWPAPGGLTVGRGKRDGAPVDHLVGSVDEVEAHLGVLPGDEIQRRAGRPGAAKGQLARFVDDAGDRYTGSTSAAARPGYRFEAVLGQLPPDGVTEGTKVLYSCLFGTDTFTSTDPACEGKQVVGEVGRVYAEAPASGGIAVWRCNTGPDHFESRDPSCEGAQAEHVLGYLGARAAITRTVDHHGEHWTSIDAAPAGYRVENDYGFVALTAEPGTKPLLACVTGVDQFLSVTGCGDARGAGQVGHIWEQAPEGVPTRVLRACVTSWGERFVSGEPDCEGHTESAVLGHVLLAARRSA